MAHVPVAGVCHCVPGRGWRHIEDRLDVDWIESLYAGRDQGGPLVKAERSQAAESGLVNAQRRERGASRIGRRLTPDRSALVEGPKRSRAQPRGGALWMAEGGSLAGTRRQCEPGDQLGGLPISQRDQHGEAVQSRPMQVAEGGGQRGVVVGRGSRLQDGRGTPPWTSALESGLPSVSAHGKSTVFSGTELKNLTSW